MGGNDLKKAEGFYRRKKYSKVLQLLEPQVFRYRESYRFFFLLGMSCLRTGDFGGGYSYLQRALSIKPGDRKALLGIAAIHLRRQETSEALRHWFQVLDDDPKNRYANRGLKILRKNVDSDHLVKLTESSKINALVPGERSFIPFVAALSFAGILAAGVLLYPVIEEYVENRFFSRREEISSLNLSIENSFADESDSSGEYSMEEKEIKKSYSRVEELFHEYKDNLARREINRLLLSNASKEVKGKLALLESHIRTPTFSTLTDNFSYKEVSQNPELYEKCHVIWRGRVSNLSIDEDAIRFDFLVGYETEEVVEGIVPVTVPFAVDINPGYPIEVLGQVELRESGLRLRARSIHQFSNENERERQ
ncbi:MAG: tetratricopeptide repeat protein [Spirochaetaceae bacterium]